MSKPGELRVFVGYHSKITSGPVAARRKSKWKEKRKEIIICSDIRFDAKTAGALTRCRSAPEKGADRCRYTIYRLHLARFPACTPSRPFVKSAAHPLVISQPPPSVSGFQFTTLRAYIIHAEILFLLRNFTFCALCLYSTQWCTLYYTLYNIAILYRDSIVLQRACGVVRPPAQGPQIFKIKMLIVFCAPI
jgi:hypothetical protein